MEDPKTKITKDKPYELLEDVEKKQIVKNIKAKMILYNALHRNSQVKNCKIDLLTKEYEKFSISNEETIDRGLTRFNVIVTSLKSLDPDYSNKNHLKVTREQTSDDSDSQRGSDEYLDGEEEDEAFNLMDKNFQKFFRKGNRLGGGNRFGNGSNELE
ncbi:hypothetical protein Tco_1466281 [Tanacetum coccineum]